MKTCKITSFWNFENFGEISPKKKKLLPHLPNIIRITGPVKIK
jgi:hypothetical protein